jgi:hypothetical protein
MEEHLYLTKVTAASVAPKRMQRVQEYGAEQLLQREILEKTSGCNTSYRSYRSNVA